MCVGMLPGMGYGAVGRGTDGKPGGKPLDKPPEVGSAPPPDMVSGKEVAPQSNRQRLAAEAQAAYDKQPQPINYRDRNPTQDKDPKRFVHRMTNWGLSMQKNPSLGMNPRRARQEGKEIDYNRVMLKYNPDGSPAAGFDDAYYANPDNWWSAKDLGMTIPGSGDDINV